MNKLAKPSAQMSGGSLTSSFGLAEDLSDRTVGRFILGRPGSCANKVRLFLARHFDAYPIKRSAKSTDR